MAINSITKMCINNILRLYIPTVVICELWLVLLLDESTATHVLILIFFLSCLVERNQYK